MDKTINNIQKTNEIPWETINSLVCKMKQIFETTFTYKNNDQQKMLNIRDVIFKDYINEYGEIVNTNVLYSNDQEFYSNEKTADEINFLVHIYLSNNNSDDMYQVEVYMRDRSLDDLIKPFEEYILFEDTYGEDRQIIFHFPNNYGASVKSNEHTYGGFEVDILTFENSNPNTMWQTLTDFSEKDILGFQDAETLEKSLDKIKNLDNYK